MIKFRGQLYREASIQIALNRTHFLTKAGKPDPRLPVDAEKWWTLWSLDYTNHNSDAVVTAMDNDDLVGFVRYSVKSKKRLILAEGTWVAPAYRKAGIGSQMWEYLIHREKPDAVEVLIESHEGSYLFEALENKFPTIKWTLNYGV